MMSVVEANSLVFIIALLIGLATGWWLFRAMRSTSPGPAERSGGDTLEAGEPRDLRAAPRTPIRDGVDTVEGQNIATDGPAAATGDVAGELLGVAVRRGPAGAGGPPDDLRTLKGVGPRLADQLNQNGIYRFDQLAGLSEVEAGLLDQRLGAFRGRVARDRLVEQASYLARGDKDGFEAKFGKLGGGA